MAEVATGNQPKHWLETIFQIDKVIVAVVSLLIGGAFAAIADWWREDRAARAALKPLYLDVVKVSRRLYEFEWLPRYSLQELNSGDAISGYRKTATCESVQKRHATKPISGLINVEAAKPALAKIDVTVGTRFQDVALAIEEFEAPLPWTCVTEPGIYVERIVDRSHEVRRRIYLLQVAIANTYNGFKTDQGFNEDNAINMPSPPPKREEPKTEAKSSAKTATK